MKEITIAMPAKINLSIDVLNKLANGYHAVEMIMQAVDLYDTITVGKKKSGISVRCAQPYVPNDQRNIAWKAAELFFSKYPCNGGAQISIKKNIPVSAGLGGGSTDAAGVLKALNILYGACFEKEQLVALSRCLGADVAFCLNGGTQLAVGIGDELTGLPDLEGVDIVLVKPDFPVSTPWVYKNLDLNQLGERPDTTGIIRAVRTRDIDFIASNMRNVLESVTAKEHPEIKTILEKLMEYGALGSRMSGSGPTVFGIFTDASVAQAAKEKLLKEYTHVYYTKTIGRERE